MKTLRERPRRVNLSNTAPRTYHEAACRLPPSNARSNPAEILARDLRQAIAQHLRHPELSSDEILLKKTVGGFRIVLALAPKNNHDIPLSPRELEIADLIARGLSNKMIAAALGISGWTVNTHLRRMFAKLGVFSRAAMIAKLR
jgi:DNA-binding CsgD family transcriptional regulator